MFQSYKVTKLQKDKDTGAVTKLKKNQISTPSGKKQVIKISFKKFNEHLKLDGENEEKLNLTTKSKNDNTPQIPAVRQAQTTLEKPFMETKVVNSIDAFEEIVGVTAKTDMTTTTSDDTALAKSMIQGGFT